MNLKRVKHLLTICIIIIGFAVVTEAQSYPGYTLYGPNNGKYTYLINSSNAVVHSWTHSKSGGYSQYLLSDGSVIRSAVSTNSSLNGGGATGVVQKYSWAGALTWEYTYSSSTYRSHHDICPMPNGNVLLIAWETKTAAQAVQAGLNHSGVIWPDHIVEVQPVGSTGGNIVWEWHAWDHLIQDYSSSKDNYGVVADHPELLDLNVGSSATGDWMHINGISYNPDLDQIVISSHNLDEVYVIDHSTTTAQAKTHAGGKWGKGGDFLYRWGCPSNYRAAGTHVFDVVHSAAWIPAGLPGAGHILAFNNRESQSTSMVVELALPTDTAGNYIRTAGSAYGPLSPVWSYTASGFFSVHLGGVQRLPNGNTMIAQSTSGKLFEVTSSGTVVWSYTPGGEIVRVLRYGFSFPGVSALVPVELTAFTVQKSGNSNILHWTTATEKNNSYFEIESSSDNSVFSSIGRVSGNGTTLVAHSYQFEDNAQSTGITYYRLKQVDYNGNCQYSETISSANTILPVQSNLYQNYPNPFNPTTTIAFKASRTGNTKLAVFNQLGEQVALLFDEATIAGKEYSVNCTIKNLPSGVYIYTLIAGDQRISKKMLFLK
ncbi:MAG: aryl-sulfate sulfotransferase [Ignavibacteria bacterium]|nr:aryl-sulfate sulfotransferase [Ignavibacteria bacterium]